MEVDYILSEDKFLEAYVPEELEIRNLVNAELNDIILFRDSKERRFGNNLIKVFTDASTSRGRSPTGLGIVIVYPNGKVLQVSVHRRDISDINIGEMEAIRTYFDYYDNSDCDVMIISDSSSSIEVINNIYNGQYGGNKSPVAVKLRSIAVNIVECMRYRRGVVALAHVNSHCSRSIGNDLADSAASFARRKVYEYTERELHYSNLAVF